MSFAIENEKESSVSCLNTQITGEDKKLHLSTVNQLYTLYKPEFIHFFRAFHDSLISLALFTHLSIDASI